MNQKIRIKINKDSIEKLLNLKGLQCNIMKDSLDETKIIDNMNFNIARFLRIELDLSRYLITNIPEVQITGEEYPKIYINDEENPKMYFDEEKIPENFDYIVRDKTIEAIYLINDHLICIEEGNSWESKVDIGLKIVFSDKSTVIIMARDSIVGLFDIWNFSNLYSFKKSKIKILEFWSIDSTELDFFSKIERTEKKII